MLFRQSVHLLGGHDNILVVGQDEHRLRRDLIDHQKNVLGGGIHGLPAGDHAIHPKILKHGSNAVSGAHRDRAVFLFRRSDLRLKLLLAHDLLRVLKAHILHLHRNEGAIGQGLLHGLAGVVRMNMDLNDLVVVHQHQAVAQLGQEGAQRLGVLVILPGDDKLRAVGEGNILILKVREAGLLLGLGRSGLLRGVDLLPPQGAEHSVQD